MNNIKNLIGAGSLLLFLYSCSLFFPPAISRVITDNINNTNAPAVTFSPTGDITTNHSFGVILSVDRNYGYWSTNENSFSKFSHGTGANLNINTNVNLLYYGEDDFNHTSATQTIVYTLDTTVPTVAITQPTGNISVNQNSYAVMGTAYDNVGLKGVYFRRNGSVFYLLNSPSNWSTNLTDLAEGSNLIEVYAKDISGNTGATQNVIITVHTGAPVVTLNPIGTIITNAPFTLTLSVDKDFGYWSTNGLSSFVQFGSNANVSLFISNNTSLFYYGEDTIGNRSATGNMDYTIDKNAPIITASMPNDILTNQPFDVTLSVNENHGYWSTNNSAFVQFSSNTNVSLNIGKDTSILYYGEDPLHNTSVTQTVVYRIEPKFFAYDAVGGDHFGQSTAISADESTIVAGAPFATNNNGTSAGAVYHFYRNGSAWITNKFTAFDGAKNNYFGTSVAISADGNTFVSGASYAVNGSSIPTGAVYRFHRIGSVWETNKFTAFDGANGDQFGYSVAVSADESTIVVGAPGATNNNGANEGAVYRFHRIGSIWITNKFTAFDGTNGDQFGYSVAVSADGNAFVVGANHDDDNGTDAGSVYRFQWTGSNWITNKFTAFDGDTSDNFGMSVAISADGNTIVAGAPYKNSSTGAVYRIQFIDSNWQTTNITVSDSAFNDHIGQSVAVSSDGNTVFAGAPSATNRSGITTGAVYRYYWTGSDWQTTNITAFDGDTSDNFGISIAISSNGNTLIAGAYLKDNKNSTDVGAAYLYESPWN